MDDAMVGPPKSTRRNRKGSAFHATEPETMANGCVGPQVRARTKRGPVQALWLHVHKPPRPQCWYGSEFRADLERGWRRPLARPCAHCFATFNQPALCALWAGGPKKTRVCVCVCVCGCVQTVCTSLARPSDPPRTFGETTLQRGACSRERERKSRKKTPSSDALYNVWSCISMQPALHKDN